jgi:ARC6-like, IMS domain/DnaJ domain
VRIPLDYYRILGVTIQATDEQLNQAYHDRGAQLPRREYSAEAIESRRNLIEEAYRILSHQEKRDRYNSEFLEKTYQARAQEYGRTPTQESLKDSEAIYDRTPWIDILPEQFVGALLILQDLGEYELVLRLGITELNKRADLLELNNSDEPKAIEHSDIILTLALAYLELGREQWQQEEYQNAAISGQMGLDLLLEEGLFPSVRDEIQIDLAKLRPYRILTLLSVYPEESSQREQGLQLLRDMLQARGGIDGKYDDGSGLDIDRFLRFIQQVRQQLTTLEQQQLFEVEADRPSAVATYLIVYTLLARGFAERQPGLIVNAKELLALLSKRQDVYLERAVCALLLGQTDEASEVLTMSQDIEPLEYIRQNSQGAPDLLPGLCLYGEHWLQTEVLTQFRDLANRPDSLKEYFADTNVQNYLERLPLHLEEIATAKITTTKEQRSQQLISSVVEHLTLENRGLEQTRSSHKNVRPIHSTMTTLEKPMRSKHSTAPKENKKISYLFDNGGVVGNPNSNRVTRPRKKASTLLILSKIGQKALQKLLQPSRNKRRPSWQNRYLLIVPAAIASMGMVGFLYAQAQLKQDPTPQIEEEQVHIRLDQPQIHLPPKPAETPPVKQVLTKETAREVIQTWLASKAQAFGSTHKVDQLKTILLPPLLTQWQKRAEDAKKANTHMQYRHSISVRSVQTNEQKPDLAIVEAQIKEIARNYLAGKPNQANSYDDTLVVRYELVRHQDRWMIKNLKVVK